MAGKVQLTDLDWLKTSDHPTAHLYRLILYSHEPLTTFEMIERIGVSARSSFNRLTASGWIVRCGRKTLPGRIRSEPAYIARLEASAAEVPKERRDIASARKRLTDLAILAGKARRTGLAFQMSRALDRIESEIREVRELLPHNKSDCEKIA